MAVGAAQTEVGSDFHSIVVVSRMGQHIKRKGTGRGGFDEIGRLK